MGEAGVGSGGVSTVLRTSVATLYSNLVTRPTGRAVRLAIERQVREAEGASLAVLDFTHVGIVDFSCADEVIAKLLRKYVRTDRPADAFFLAQGVSEHHRDPIETTLRRHGLLLVAMDVDGRRRLWGAAPGRLREAWSHLDALGRALPDDFATDRGLSRATARSWLQRLVSGRVAVVDELGGVCTLCAMLGGPAGLGDVDPHRGQV
jgi:hypothetical protein